MNEVACRLRGAGCNVGNLMSLLVKRFDAQKWPSPHPGTGYYASLFSFLTFKLDRLDDRRKAGQEAAQEAQEVQTRAAVEAATAAAVEAAAVKDTAAGNGGGIVDEDATDED
mmetsp:Transcript_86545/g.172741  ORF Transcript_86545/g.172741 Transcript_86545/m.172741 type:complete len:112 (-) Transcript_86545:66-401(-)